jgi:hypothetical protein
MKPSRKELSPRDVAKVAKLLGLPLLRIIVDRDSQGFAINLGFSGGTLYGGKGTQQAPPFGPSSANDD